MSVKKCVETFALPWGIGISTVPGKMVGTDVIFHYVGGEGVVTMFGTPWGTGTAVTRGGWIFKLSTLGGQGMDYSVDTYAAGGFKGTVTFKFTGVGYLMYQGPTVSAYGLTLTDGMVLGGLTYSCKVEKEGFGGFAGMHSKSTTALGVSYTDPNSGNSYSVLYETGIYW